MKETPLAELFVDGMSDEQIWAELELRAENVCNLLNYALDGPTPGGESAEDGEEGEDGDDEEQERELKKMRQALIDEGFDPAELEGLELDGDDYEDEEDDDDSEEEEDESEEEDEDVGAALEEGVEELRDPSSDEDEDEEDLETGEPSFLSGGKRTFRLKPKRGGHPVLDDGFFDLAAFNAEIEAAESKNVSRGRLSKDDDEEDDDDESVDLFAPVDDNAAFDEEDLENGGGTSHCPRLRLRAKYIGCYRFVLQRLLRAA